MGIEKEFQVCTQKKRKKCNFEMKEKSVIIIIIIIIRLAIP